MDEKTDQGQYEHEVFGRPLETAQSLPMLPDGELEAAGRNGDVFAIAQPIHRNEGVESLIKTGDGERFALIVVLHRENAEFGLGGRKTVALARDLELVLASGDAETRIQPVDVADAGFVDGVALLIGAGDSDKSKRHALEAFGVIHKSRAAEMVMMSKAAGKPSTAASKDKVCHKKEHKNDEKKH